LLPGDEILALFDCNCLRPPADAIAVTSFRIGGVASTRSSANPSSRRRSGPHISGPATSKEQAAIPADDEMRFP
jgi:hypothetical protein